MAEFNSELIISYVDMTTMKTTTVLRDDPNLTTKTTLGSTEYNNINYDVFKTTDYKQENYSPTTGHNTKTMSLRYNNFCRSIYHGPQYCLSIKNVMYRGSLVVNTCVQKSDQKLSSSTSQEDIAYTLYYNTSDAALSSNSSLSKGIFMASGPGNVYSYMYFRSVAIAVPVPTIWNVL